MMKNKVLKALNFSFDFTDSLKVEKLFFLTLPTLFVLVKNADYENQPPKIGFCMDLPKEKISAFSS